MNATIKGNLIKGERLISDTQQTIYGVHVIRLLLCETEM